MTLKKGAPIINCGLSKGTSQWHSHGLRVSKKVSADEAKTNNEEVKSRQEKGLLVDAVMPDGHDMQQKKLNHSYAPKTWINPLRSCVVLYHLLEVSCLPFSHMIKGLRI